MVRRFNPELKGQEITFAWGNLQESIHLRVYDLDRPAVGDRRLLIEGMIVRNPGTGDAEFASYNAVHDQYYRGRITLDEDGNVVRDYTTHFAAADSADFREVWAWTGENRSQFVWKTTRLGDDPPEADNVVVRWSRVR